MSEKAHWASAAGTKLAHLSAIPLGMQPVLKQIVTVRALFSAWAGQPLLAVEAEDGQVAAWVPACCHLSSVGKGAHRPIMPVSLGAWHHLISIHQELLRAQVIVFASNSVLQVGRRSRCRRERLHSLSFQ